MVIIKLSVVCHVVHDVVTPVEQSSLGDIPKVVGCKVNFNSRIDAFRGNIYSLDAWNLFKGCVKYARSYKRSVMVMAGAPLHLCA